MKSRVTAIAAVAALSSIAVAVLSACGGGSGNSSYASTSNNSNGNTTTSNTYTPGVFLAESTFAARCATPRTGTDPYTKTPYADVQGTGTDENNWLRSWTNDLYLWYSEVPDLNPASYTTANYFPLLKTSGLDAAGNPKDKFHFTYVTSQWEALSQSNTDVGYGVQFEILQSTPPREVVIAFTEPGSAASQAPASLARGATILSVDGVDINTNTSSGVDTLNAGLSPSAVGESHTFTVQDLGSSSSRTVTLQAANVTSKSVPLVQTLATPTGTVGYLLFNNQLAQAETELVTAVNTLKSAAVKDLVLDIRYNGGGYLDIASELAYMIADPNMTAGQTFELVQFNTKHPSTDPVTGNAITPTAFHSTTQGFSMSSGQALPNLGLQRVFVLTTSGTCSASESVMNSLQGVGVQVIQIGATTCGKPYGFYPADNCGTTYFSIQFRGVNSRSFGDYPDGFTPSSALTTSSGTSATLPGCTVKDDFTHQLGDQNESLLFVALGYRAGQSCTVPPAGLSPGMTIKQMSRPASEGSLVRPPVREIRILHPGQT